MKWFTRKKKNKLEKEIDTVYDCLNGYDEFDEGYEKRLNILERLEKIKSDKDERKVHPDTIVKATAYIAGIGLILAFEVKNVITSKAFGHLFKMNL